MVKFSIVTSAYNQLDQLKRMREHLDKQTFTDFEWIIADDGSSDGTDKWAKKNADKHVWQEDKGYRLTKILNKACFEASGEFLVWIMGDSYPHQCFLERLNDYIHPNMMLTGMRINVDDDGYAVSRDWREDLVNIPPNTEMLIIKDDPYPWRFMTLNSMAMPKEKFIEMGGIHSGYDEGYGKMDWWMAAWAYYNGMEMGWVLRAILYHQIHKEREDTDNNTKLFEKHVKEMDENSTRL